MTFWEALIPPFATPSWIAALAAWSCVKCRMAGRCFEKCALPASDHVANLSTLQSQPWRACTVCTMMCLHCVHYVPSPITQTLNWTGCNWSGTYILGLFFCEEVMLYLLSCVNLFLLWGWTDMLWPCMATYFWFPYQCYLRQTQSCFSRRPSYLREKFKNIPFSWVHPVWGTVEEVHGVKFQLDLVLVLVLSSSIIGC